MRFWSLSRLDYVIDPLLLGIDNNQSSCKVITGAPAPIDTDKVSLESLS